MKISGGARRSTPLDGGAQADEPRSRGLRAAGLIIGALVLMAALAIAAPYLSSALKQEFSILSGYANNGGGTSPLVGPTYAASTQAVQCSSAVSVKGLASPDIKNSSADISYPPDYCTLASYALQLINSDRATNGTGPVSLGYNQAAQQHADSMLYYRYFSHYDTQGYKPYMRYSLLGGRGADFENVAFMSYCESFSLGVCPLTGHFTSTSGVESAIAALEHSMVYNDSACCNNGHRYNILSPLHNVVSIGVAYDGNTVFFDEEFENDYIALNFTVTSAPNPYYVTMTGALTQQVTSPTQIDVFFDGTPAAESAATLNSGPHEYGPGTFVGGVTPPTFLGCGQFTQGITVCADQWKFSSSGVDIAFSLNDFVKEYGPGVYSVYLVIGSDSSSAITTISVFVTQPSP